MATWPINEQVSAAGRMRGRRGSRRARLTRRKICGAGSSSGFPCRRLGPRVRMRADDTGSHWQNLPVKCNTKGEELVTARNKFVFRGTGQIQSYRKLYNSLVQASSEVQLGIEMACRGRSAARARSVRNTVL